MQRCHDENFEVQREEHDEILAQMLCVCGGGGGKDVEEERQR